MRTGRDIYSIMKILEDYSALSYNKQVYKIKESDNIYCYKSNSYREFEVLKQIGKNKNIPQLIRYDSNSKCLIKSWCDGETIDKFVPWRDDSLWTTDNIRKFILFTSEVFHMFHRHNLMLIDYKPRNISYNDKFMFFDFDCVIEPNKGIRRDLGSSKSPFRSFESLYGDPLASTNDDYFSFANIIYNGLVTYPEWSNNYKDPIKALEQFELEYITLSPKLEKALNLTKLHTTEKEFILKCFNPIRQYRPTSFKELI